MNPRRSRAQTPPRKSQKSKSSASRQATARRPVLSDRQVCPPRDAQLVEGIARFNHQQFFECHEILEQRWLATTDASKDFYKGLIQAAVACYHWSRGNPAGALTLARSACTYLQRYRPVCGGVDVEDFHARFSELFRWLRRHPQRYDPRLVPAIRWA